MARMKTRYTKEVVPALMKELGYKNVMQVPRLEKIVINVGLGEAIQNAKLLDNVTKELGLIAGQKAVVTKAKKSIAGFKIRQGMSIGAKVTLRGDRMYEFFDRLINVALPRIRDFKGISPKAFDPSGNYTLGLKEQMIFPEIHFDDVSATHGMDVCIVSSTKNPEEGRALLRHLGMPFRN